MTVPQLIQVVEYGIAIATVFVAIPASAHAILYKRDSRAAMLWLGFIWLMPLLGGVFYFILGINRIKRRAVLLRGSLERYRTAPHATPCLPGELDRHLPAHGRHLNSLAEAVHQLVTRPLVPGNRIEMLVNGDQAYPAMLDAIDHATRTVSLSSYIFDRDAVGLEFAAALGRAVKRGVEVRVLVDATGARYSWPSILRVLRREGVRYARFLPTFPYWQLLSVNLRSHRKILVVDGQVGFTGGMNIRIGHCLQRHPKAPVQDLHFRLEGPVVAQLQEAFADDWLFADGESLRGDGWFPALQSRGPVIARGITDGPDEDLDKLRWALLAALASARESIRIATPYFLPEPSLISALNVAAMRGVEVDIILPSVNNLPFCDWASRAHWWQVLEHGCRIWLSPGPFDHSKVFVVDDCWSLIGSANWDPRSLRLNFEFNVECYDAEFAGVLAGWFNEKLGQSKQVTLEQMDARGMAVRLRDGIARLATPYL
ncbi:MAG: phospholipase D-like domain-containing protein [Verrucomicrobiota bacterium]